MSRLQPERPFNPIAMRPFRHLILSMTMVLFLFSGCAAGVRAGGVGGIKVGRGIYHTVGKGETLWRICYTYGVDMADVARANRIKDTTQIDKGSRIFIPGARKVLKVTPYPTEASLDNGRKAPPAYLKNKPKYLWPVSGKVSSGFGVRNGVMHDGIDIRVPEGTRIKSADEGVVVYEGDALRGYGNIIIIKHIDNFYTVYAHNKRNLVTEGNKVSKGDVIATVGRTGNATNHQLHFEVRQGRTTLNPLFFLP